MTATLLLADPPVHQAGVDEGHRGDPARPFPRRLGTEPPTGRRCVAVRGGHVCAAFYDDSPQWGEVSHRGPRWNVYEQAPGPTWSMDVRAPVIYIAGHCPPEDQARSFGAWVDKTHLPAMSRVAGVFAAYRFVLTNRPQGGRAVNCPKVLTVSLLASTCVVEDSAFEHEQALARAMAYVPDVAPFVLVADLVRTLGEEACVMTVAGWPDIANTGERF